jgi:hypothetical protein
LWLCFHPPNSSPSYFSSTCKIQQTRRLPCYKQSNQLLYIYIYICHSSEDLEVPFWWKWHQLESLRNKFGHFSPRYTCEDVVQKFHSPLPLPVNPPRRCFTWKIHVHENQRTIYYCFGCKSQVLVCGWLGEIQAA